MTQPLWRIGAWRVLFVAHRSPVGVGRQDGAK